VAVRYNIHLAEVGIVARKAQVVRRVLSGHKDLVVHKVVHKDLVADNSLVEEVDIDHIEEVVVLHV